MCNIDRFLQSLCLIGTHLLQVATLELIILNLFCINVTLIQMYMFNRRSPLQFIYIESSLVSKADKTRL